MALLSFLIKKDLPTAEPKFRHTSAEAVLLLNQHNESQLRGTTPIGRKIGKQRQDGPTNYNMCSTSSSSSHIPIEHQKSCRISFRKISEGCNISSTIKDVAVSQLQDHQDKTVLGKITIDDIKTALSDCRSEQRDGDLIKTIKEQSMFKQKQEQFFDAASTTKVELPSKPYTARKAKMKKNDFKLHSNPTINCKHKDRFEARSSIKIGCIKESRKEDLKYTRTLYAKPGEFLSITYTQLPNTQKPIQSEVWNSGLLSFRNTKSSKIKKIDPKILFLHPTDMSAGLPREIVGCNSITSLDCKQKWIKKREAAVITDIESDKIQQDTENIQSFRNPNLERPAKRAKIRHLQSKCFVQTSSTNNQEWTSLATKTSIERSKRKRDETAEIEQSNSEGSSKKKIKTTVVTNSPISFQLPQDTTLYRNGYQTLHSDIPSSSNGKTSDTQLPQSGTKRKTPETTPSLEQEKFENPTRRAKIRKFKRTSPIAKPGFH